MTNPPPVSSTGHLFGAHISVSGGAHFAFERALELGCRTMQIFVKNANRWQQRPFTSEEIELFRQTAASNRDSAQPISPVLAHASYLINLAGEDPELRRKSLAALTDELQRCDQLGVTGLVLHPGSHLGRGVDAGIESIVRGLDHIFDQHQGECRVLLENTAGQGYTLGRDLAELADILAEVAQPQRVGVCIDTCHAFAAGHGLHRLEASGGSVHRDSAGYQAFWSEVFERFPPPVLACLHLNDSKGGFGSRLDRHENLGEGQIGAEFFRRLTQEPRLEAIPMILETPKGGGQQDGYRKDLERLRSWSAGCEDP